MDGGFLWPDPLIQLNPSFEAGETLQQLIDDGELHPECINIFRDKREDGTDGAAAALARLTGLDPALCEAKLRRALLSGFLCHDENDHPLFAFRLHQFVSKGDSVYASPEPEAVRHVTLQAQQFVPGSERTKVLLPVAFCRECGQARRVDAGDPRERGRDLERRLHDPGGRNGRRRSDALRRGILAA
jgi:hypothetical protein